MPRPKKQEGGKAPTQSGANGTGRLPVTTHTGVNAAGTKSVLVSALLEVTGQVRFGDGTDIATTITEKDVVLSPDGKTVAAGTDNGHIELLDLATGARAADSRTSGPGGLESKMLCTRTLRHVSNLLVVWLYGHNTRTGERGQGY
jgi:WD40 repeat protein